MPNGLQYQNARINSGASSTRGTELSTNTKLSTSHWHSGYQVKHSLFKDSVVFAASRYVLLGLSLIRNFFVAKFLGPSDYGLWVVIGLLLTYGDQIHLGLRHAGDKEIPYYRG